MWNRSNLKQDAKQRLQGRYWSAFAVALITTLIGGGGRFGGSSYRMDRRDSDWFQNGNWQPGNWRAMFEEMVANIDPAVVILVIAGVLLVTLFAILFSIFVSNVIEAGGARWFSRSREMQNPPSIGFMFSLFRAGNYMPTVAAQFWRTLFLLLWGLIPAGVALVGGIALFVPLFSAAETGGEAAAESWLVNGGAALTVAYVLVLLLVSLIVVNRSYAYRMVPWILGDNPKIGRRRALSLSIEMTRGHKFAMFVLDLSFLGWFFLGVLACGVGILFVMPYYQASIAELYDRLRALSVEKGAARMEDFGFVRVEST